MTARLEFMVPRGDSEAFNTAFYRFLEVKGHACGEDVKLESAAFGPVDRKLVTLGDDAALIDFANFWSRSRRSLPASRQRPASFG